MPPSAPLFKKVLIANRGEIACRIARTCRRLGVATVAVYSDADANALHVRMADESVHIGPSESAQSYLQQEKIIAAARQTGAEAVHPGYGFLSENAAFAAALAAADLTFIGPQPEVMKKLGDKIEAKKIAAKASVPMVPGLLFSSAEEISILAEARTFCAEHGYPVMIKAAAGGGGRGMRRVDQESGLADSLGAAAREAKAAFGDGRLFMEKLVEHARHVEVQIFGDASGEVVSLFDRDCSMQRNHQKVIEEAPAPGLSDKTRQAMQKAARDLCSAAGYRNAGTVEFLVDQKQQFYFLEVNSRLQVEHPVTEAITGLDLVELQLRIASGQKLSSMLPALTAPYGAAIECRICAESPDDNFVASTGKLSLFEAPAALQGDGAANCSVRFDSGFEKGSTVSHYYDSMLAKLVVHARSRQEAIRGTIQALEHLSICGVRSNIGFLLALVRSNAFAAVAHDTHFARSVLLDSVARERELSVAAALSVIHGITASREQPDAWQRNSLFRVASSPRFEISALVNGKLVAIQVSPQPPGATFLVQGASLELALTVVKAGAETLEFTTPGLKDSAARVVNCGGAAWVITKFGTFEVREQLKTLKKSGKRTESHSGVIASPLPGKIVHVRTSVGSKLAAGEPILVIESMKMEHIIRAPHDAEVKDIKVQVGDVVEASATLAELQFSE